MPTTLSDTDCRRQALSILSRVTAYKGTMWEDDERQVALMAMVEARKVCETKHARTVQAYYIQQYVRGRLKSWREKMQRRTFESALWRNEEGDEELIEAPVEATQEDEAERAEQCRAVAEAMRRLSAKDRKVVAAMLNPAMNDLERGESVGLSPQGFYNGKKRVIRAIRELVGGEGIS
jgi:DNA-directed RNA polymerase specialized sigma subunit